MTIDEPALCPTCGRAPERCICVPKDVPPLLVPDQEATCPECHQPWELCGCESFQRAQEDHDNDPGPPSWRPGSHYITPPHERGL